MKNKKIFLFAYFSGNKKQLLPKIKIIAEKIKGVINSDSFEIWSSVQVQSSRNSKTLISEIKPKIFLQFKELNLRKTNYHKTCDFLFSEIKERETEVNLIVILHPEEVARLPVYFGHPKKEIEEGDILIIEKSEGDHHKLQVLRYEN
jgi:hypothetical protein